jgi:hypothetical protein
MSVRIRQAVPADLDAIAALHVETHLVTYAPLIDGPYEGISLENAPPQSSQTPGAWSRNSSG